MHYFHFNHLVFFCLKFVFWILMTASNAIHCFYYFHSVFRTYLIHHFYVFISSKFLIIINCWVIWKCSIRCINNILLILLSVYLDFDRGIFFSFLVFRVFLLIHTSSWTLIFIVLTVISFLITNYWIKVTWVIFANLNFLNKCILLF